MRALALISLMIIGGIAKADVVAIPGNLCGSMKCGVEQAEMYNRFMQNGMSPTVLQKEAVYSGSCRWSGSYSTEIEHHAGFFLYEPTDGKGVAFRGRFSFFTAQNPYRSFDAEQARKLWFSNPKDPVLLDGGDFGFYDVTPGGEARHRIWYWFRADSVNPNILYILTLWGYSDYGICELTLN